MTSKADSTPRDALAQEQLIWQLLEQVKDPEIPVVSVVEMGIIRGVTLEDDHVQVTMTPTFSGCPALHAMQTDVKQTLAAAGYDGVEICITHNPPWTSDWITPEARQKLKDFGLAPPPIHNGQFEILLLDTVRCPYCDSTDTSIKNTFGSTLCRAIYYCQNCQQAFEQFKPL
jgi:ring-1,2-phenylacetyl-CoA epoxidase subunit PaaD